MTQEHRAWWALDWLVREYLPAWLDLAKLMADAAQIRALPEVTSETVSAAMTEIKRARVAADNAWQSKSGGDHLASAMAWSIAGDVGPVADIASDRASAACCAAAMAAASAAAWAAVWTDASADLAPIVDATQASALRMIGRHE